MVIAATCFPSEASATPTTHTTLLLLILSCWASSTKRAPHIYPITLLRHTKTLDHNKDVTETHSKAMTRLPAASQEAVKTLQTWTMFSVFYFATTSDFHVAQYGHRCFNMTLSIKVYFILSLKRILSTCFCSNL